MIAALGLLPFNLTSHNTAQWRLYLINSIAEATSMSFYPSSSASLQVSWSDLFPPGLKRSEVGPHRGGGGGSTPVASGQT